jgi:DNA polymerase-3 subunit delta'
MALADIAGQQRAIGFLRRLLKNGAVPHAFLFSGTAGAGKLDAARQFAKALNCLSPKDYDSCGACGSCRKLEEGLHPDVVQIRSEGVFIKLEQIRELIKRFRFRPFEGKFRVVIIEDAHRLNEAAANALLKMLEEPPEANVFILLAPESQLLLPTIVSRCSQIRFQPLDDEIVAQWLVREGGLSQDRAAAVARLAAGSTDKARWFSEEDRAGGWRKVIEKLENLDGISILDFFPMVSDWARTCETAEQDLEFIKLWVREIILHRFGAVEPPGGLWPRTVPPLPPDSSLPGQASAALSAGGPGSQAPPARPAPAPDAPGFKPSGAQPALPPSGSTGYGSGATLAPTLSAATRRAALSVPAEHLFFLYHKVEQAMQGLKVNANLQMALEGVCLAIKDSLYGKGDWNSFQKGRQDLPF